MADKMQIRVMPFFDADDSAGAGAPAAVVDAPTPAADEGGGSLADHEASFEASFAPGSDVAAEKDDDAPTADRDDRGQFKPRHRAASQRADIDDVPTINAHTKRIKDAEAKLGADIVRQDGESERAFTLRRRAELLERQAAAPAATPAPAARREETAPRPVPAPAVAAPASFPAFDAWLATAGNEAKTFEDFIDARQAHNYTALRNAERRDEATRTAQQQQQDVLRKYVTDERTFKAETPDYDAVIATVGPQDVSLVVQQAVYELGPQLAYYLASHPDILRGLTDDTLVLPDNPAFTATVAATKRYLSTLVASQRPAAPAVRAAAPVRAPSPPNPVRTGSSRADTDVPGDDATLAEHERAFGPRRR